jgi:hypothetical protein
MNRVSQLLFWGVLVQCRYKEAGKFLPHSTILGLAHADHLESQGKNPEAQVVYEQMLKRLGDKEGGDLTLVYIQCVPLRRHRS